MPTPIDFEKTAISALLRTTSQSLVLLDVGAVVRWASPSATRLGDIVGRNLAELVHPDDLARAAAGFVSPDFDTVEDEQSALIAEVTIPVRLLTPSGLTRVSATGRWVQDDVDGEWWFAAVLHHVQTGVAIEQAINIVAAGTSESRSLGAIIDATRQFAGVLGAHLLWTSSTSRQRSLGDLGSSYQAASRLVGSATRPSAPRALDTVIGDSTWGIESPLHRGDQVFGSLTVWGLGPPPSLEFRTEVFAPLVDLAELAIDRHEHIANLEERAATDPLTGRLNRRAFETELEACGDSAAVLYIDIDDFKPINDTHGHTVGDELLKAVGKRLKGALRAESTVGRLGGDEFAVLLRSVTPDGARGVADRLLGVLAKPFDISGRTIAIGASIGVAHGTDPTAGAALVERADLALLEAKSTGKGTVVVAAVHAA